MLADELSDLGDARVLLHLEHSSGDLVLLFELCETFVSILVHRAELPHTEGRQATVRAGSTNANLTVEWIALAL